MIIFSSFGRPGAQGGGDLYISLKDMTGHWTPARDLGPLINTPQLDYCPFVDQDNHLFYFTSTKPPAFEGKLNLGTFISLLQLPENGSGNIYYTSLKTLGL